MSPIQTPWDLRLNIDGTSFANRAQENDEALANAIPSNPAVLWLTSAQTTTHTAASGEYAICTSGTFTVTSPTNSGGRQFAVMNIGTGLITVAAASGSIFGPGWQSGGTFGVASITLAQGSYVVLVCGGTNWFVFAAGGNSGWVTIGNGSMTNSWVTGTFTVAYHKDANGYVHIRGSVKNGTNGATILTMPAGFRPGQQLTIAITQTTPVYGDLLITAAGAIVPVVTAATTNELFLDPLTYLAEN